MYEVFVHNATIFSSRRRANYSHNAHMGRIAEQVQAVRLSGRTKSGRPPSQRVVAKALGMPATSYSYYEKGYKEEWLPQDFALRLATVLAPYGVPREKVLDLASVNEVAPGAALPSVRLIQSVLGVIFEHERGVDVPEDVLQDYAIALQDVCSAVASGELVETDDQAVRAKVRSSLAVLQMKAQASAGS